MYIPSMKRNPFKVEPPFIVSFSGGRTSGYLLRHVLDAWGGKLPKGGEVMFANTGREHPSTLDFVRDVERWCPINWVEYRRDFPFYALVEHGDASRNGEPFAALIEAKKYLPNPVTRFCTSDLKVTPMKRFMKVLGFPKYTTILGLRADEPRRVAKLRSDPTRDIEMPLADAGITRDMIIEWWKQNDFDLKLPNDDPAFGNCDLCFLKGMARVERVIRAEPHLADWWIEQERLRDARFRKDRPTYAHLLTQITLQGVLFQESTDDHTVPCDCTD